MTKELLIEKLESLKSEVVGLELYFFLKNEDVRLVELDQELAKKLQQQFLEEVDSKFNNEQHYELMNIEEIDDERANTYYYFDNENMYDKVSFLLDFAKDKKYEKFSISEHDLSLIKAFLIKIGNEENNFLLYKNHDAFNLLKKDKMLRLFKKGDKFEEVEGDIISFNRNFDFLLIEEHLIIKNLNTLERTMAYTDVIHKKAIDNIEIIKTLDFLEDLDSLKEHVTTTRLAKKFNKVQSSPVIKVIQSDMDKVIKFIKKHPITKDKLKLNEDEKLILNTKKSVEIFLKLLDDDYLQSELTKLLYDSRSKDGV